MTHLLQRLRREEIAAFEEIAKTPHFDNTPPNVIEAILQELGRSLGSPIAKLKRSAAYCISHMGSRGCNITTQIGRLAALLDPGDETDEKLRSTAARALGSSASPTATPHIETALSDPNETVRCQAAIALEELSDSGVDISGTAPTLKREYEHCSSVEARASFLSVMGATGDPSTLPYLIQALRARDTSVIKSASMGLENLARRDVSISRARSQLTHLLHTYRDEGVRLTVAETLGYTCEPEALRDLMLALNDAHNVKVGALNGILHLAHTGVDVSESRPTVRDLACSRDVPIEVNCAAAATLGVYGAAEDMKLLERLLTSMEPKIITSTLEGFAEFADAGVDVTGYLPVFGKLLDSGNGIIRTSTCYLLGRIPDQRVVAPLTRALDDHDSHVVWRAAKALGDSAGHGLDVSEAVERLEGLAESSHHIIRESAEQALKVIRG